MKKAGFMSANCDVTINYWASRTTSRSRKLKNCGVKLSWLTLSPGPVSTTS